jgi:integrase
LLAALNHAFRKGRVASDLAWRRVERFKGVDASRNRYLTIAEAQRLVNACDADFRLLVQGALQTGARFGQLAKLRVDDFHKASGTLQLRTRKGDGTERAYWVTLTDEGVEFFRRVGAGRAGGELMFRNMGRVRRLVERSPKSALVKDSGDWRDSEQARPMAEACKRARISPPIGFHGLRHTWASLAVMNGTPLLVVAKNLGHSDTRMVERHYGHLAESYVKQAIAAGAPRFGIDATNVRALD